MYIKTLSLIAAVALCAACSSPDGPIDETDSGQVESDAATDAGDASPGTGDDASHADAGADGGDDELAAAVSRYARALCERNCSSPFASDYFYGDDLDTCTAGLIALTYWHKEEGAATTAADFDACAAAASTTSCDVFIPEECQFTGSLAVGEPCTHDNLCNTGLCDFGAPGTKCGVCVGPNAEGDACREFTLGGLVWQYCLGDVNCGSDGTCYAPAPIGEDCGPRPCASDANCISGECVSQGVAGDACDPYDSSLPGCSLDGGFVCDETVAECVAVQLRDLGESCETSVADAFCRASVCTGNNRTCEARRQENAQCNDVLQDCEMGLVCHEGVCTTFSCQQ